MCVGVAKAPLTRQRHVPSVIRVGDKKTTVYPVKLYKNIKLFSKIRNMIPFVLVTCWIGIAAAAAAEDDDDEIESLTVSDGGNLTISIQFEERDADPQVLVVRLKGSSQELMAQMICNDGSCSQKSWRPGVSLLAHRGSVTLILMNVRYNQTGLYKVRKHSNRRLENKIYNVTLYQPPLTFVPEKTASATNSTVTTGISAVSVVLALVVITGAVIYWKRRKGHFDNVPQDDRN